MKSSDCPIVRALLSKRGGITVEALPLILLLQLLQVFPEIRLLDIFFETRSTPLPSKIPPQAFVAERLWAKVAKIDLPPFRAPPSRSKEC